MKKPALLSSGTGFLLLSTIVSVAVRAPDLPRLEPLDKRRQGAAKAEVLDATREAALDRLQGKIAGVQVDWDDVFGTPKFIFNREGFLSDPDSVEEVEAKTVEALQQAPGAARDPHKAIKRFLNENKDLFGHDDSVLAGARITRDYVTEQNGMRTVAWEQQLDGVPVFESVLIGHITKHGELICLSSEFLPDVDGASSLDPAARAALRLSPPISAGQAVANAAMNIQETVSVEMITAKDNEPEGATQRQCFTAPRLVGEALADLVWLPMNRSTLRLCWRVVLEGATRRELYQVLIDAQTGDALVRHCWTFYLDDVTFTVHQ